MALTTINTEGIKNDTIKNEDVKSDAAIAGSKVAPNFGSQNIVTTGAVGIGIASPDRSLHVSHNGSDGTQLQLTGTLDSAGIKCVPASGDVFEYQAAATGCYVAYNRTDSRADIFVDGTGNVGIGDTDPTKTLTVGTATPVILLDDQSSRTLEIYGPSSTKNAAIGTASNHDLTFFTNGYDNDHLRINTSGTVCIGNDGSLADDSKADNLVIGTTSGHNGITIFSGTDKTGNIYFGDTDTSGAGNREGTITYNHSDGTNANFMRFSTAGNKERLRIDGYGNVSIGGLQPVPTDAAYNKALLHIHQDQSGTYGSEIHLTNAATGSAAGDGVFISMWNDDDVYFTNQEAAGKIRFASGGNADCLVINDDGIIGIGTDDPNLGGGGYGMHIVSSGIPELHLTKTSQGNASTDGLQIQLNGTSANIINRESGTTKFYVGGSSSDDIKLTIDDDGIVLIGRTSSGNTGNGHTFRGNDSCIFSRDSDTGETVQISRNTSDAVIVQFRAGDSGNATQIGHIDKSGSGVTYNSDSDYRKKENDVVISDGITKLKQLRPIRFNYKENSDKTFDGFFAHEVQPVVPEIVTGTKDAVVTQDDIDNGNYEQSEKGDPKYQSMDYGRLTPLLTAALQEAITKIETLETKVAALEAK